MELYFTTCKEAWDPAGGGEMYTGAQDIAPLETVSTPAGLLGEILL